MNLFGIFSSFSGGEQLHFRAYVSSSCWDTYFMITSEVNIKNAPNTSLLRMRQCSQKYELKISHQPSDSIEVDVQSVHIHSNQKIDLTV